MRSNGGEKWRGFVKFKVQRAGKLERDTKNETGGQGAKTVVEPGKGVEEATWEKQRLQDDSSSWGARMTPTRREPGLWKIFAPGPHLTTRNREKELDLSSVFRGVSSTRSSTPCRQDCPKPQHLANLSSCSSNGRWVTGV